MGHFRGCLQGVHLSQVHQQSKKYTPKLHQQSKKYTGKATLVHFLLWQAAKPSGDKCTP